MDRNTSGLSATSTPNRGRGGGAASVGPHSGASATQTGGGEWESASLHAADGEK